jgi:hypothetical protein
MPAANGNKLAKKLKPEKLFAEEPKVNMVPSKALIVRPKPSRLNKSRFFRLQKASVACRLRTALRGLPDLIVTRRRAGLGFVAVRVLFFTRGGLDVGLVTTDIFHKLKFAENGLCHHA